MEALQSHITWMAWTWQTGLFVISIISTLCVMVLLAIYRPEVERVGVLGIGTTRGDRLFISLLGAAFIHLGWIALTGADLRGASIVSVVYAMAVFRWV